MSRSEEAGIAVPAAGGCDRLARATPRRAAAVLAGELTRRPLLTAATLLTLLADACVNLAGPVAVGLIVDVLTHTSAHRTLTLALVLLAAAAVVGGLTGCGAGVLTARVTEPAIGRLRERALGAALAADAAAIEAAGSGDLTERLTADIERLSDAAAGTLATFVAAVLAILVTLCGLAALGWQFALAGLCAIPIQAHTLRWYLGRSGPVYRRAREADSDRTQRLLEALRSAPVVRALREQQLRAGQVRAASQRSVDLEQQAARMASRFYGRLNLAEYVGMGAILIAGYLSVKTGDATLGAATTAALFFNRLFGPINTVLGLFDTIQEAGSSLVRVVGVVDMAPTQLPSVTGDGRLGGGVTTVRREAVAGIAARSAATAQAAVRVDDLTVVYGNGHVALDRVTLELLPGERVALVGGSGSGKSTLARVIAGFIAPDAGAVTIGGGDVGREDRGGADSGRGRGVQGPRAVVLLEQTTHVFAGTLADDLRLVAPAATDAELREAASQAGLQLGAGTFRAELDTVVGSGGAEITDADAQHIALARLALADPAVAILDEASADAGSAAATCIERAIDRITEGRTSLVIAHRLSQAVTADRIIMLHRGRIVATGTHAGLLNENGAYARLWAAWEGTSGG